MVSKKVVLSSLVTSLVLIASLAQIASAQTPKPMLTDLRLKACQARESDIKTKMNNLVDLASKMEEKFGTTEARVVEYYASKVARNGRTVSNYDSLISDINAKKTTVDTDINKAKTDVLGFSCERLDPALFTQFRLDMQTVKTDLQNYRTAIKNLIVAVKSQSPKASPETTRAK